jgi:hypothetical protein
MILEDKMNKDLITELLPVWKNEIDGILESIKLLRTSNNTPIEKKQMLVKIKTKVNEYNKGIPDSLDVLKLLVPKDEKDLPMLKDTIMAVTLKNMAKLIKS